MFGLNFCLSTVSKREKIAALAALERVGILEQAYQRASTLSGGQQQRVAIARCLVQGAKIILADEPIASLDPESARKVMELLCQLNAEGITVVTSLHQVQMVRGYFQRAIAWRADLPEDVKTKLKDFFYSYTDEAVLGPLEWSGFDPATDDIWKPIRELDIGEQILAIQANDNLSQAEKDEQIAELNQQLEAIKRRSTRSGDRLGIGLSISG